MNTQIDSRTHFQSKIKLISEVEFKNKVKKLNPKHHEVGYPWTADTMKKGKNLYTTSIMDCIAGGIIDNNSITMFHLGTYTQAQAKKCKQKGFRIENFKRRILEKIDIQKENLHGFILGGFQMQENSKYNINKLNKIKNFYEENQIPYTEFGARRDVHYFGRFSVLYNQKEDTLYIANTLSNSRSLNGDKEKELEILKDGVIYHTYAPPEKHYARQKHKGSPLDFLKSQFREVSICKLDELV